jgi:hypothetical protein
MKEIKWLESRMSVQEVRKDVVEVDDVECSLYREDNLPQSLIDKSSRKEEEVLKAHRSPPFDSVA